MTPSISTLVRGAVIFTLFRFLDGAIAGSDPGNVDTSAMVNYEVIDAINSYVSSISQSGLDDIVPGNFTLLGSLPTPAKDSSPSFMPDVVELPEVPDLKVCAAKGANAYSRQPWEPVPDTCPIPLGRDGRRRHRRFPRLNQTPEDILDSPTADPADPNSWLPWTHRPYCGVATSHCVFTSASLPATGRGTLDNSNVASNDTSAQGISIITTPEMAAHSLHPLEFSLGPDSLEAYNKFASLPPAFAVRPHPTSPAKGEGVFATQSIRAGELVVVDRPALLAHFKVAGDEAIEAFGTDEDDHGLGPETDSDRAWMWTAAVDRLPSNVADRISSMSVLPRYKKFSNVLSATEDPTQKKPPPMFSFIENIFASNSFALTIKGYPFKALFPNSAKFNHDCQPNLSVDIAEDSMVMVMWANRDIEEGEELTISYLSELLPSDRRKKVIQRRWGFQCQCDLCTGKTDGALAASDKRRNHLPSLIRNTRKYMANGHAHAALDAILELRDLYIAEGLMRQTATTAEMLVLPELAGEEADLVNSKLMADPFGPTGLAETLGQLYLATGNKIEALPQLRAAVAEIGRQTFMSPNPEKANRVWDLVQLIDSIENEINEDDYFLL